MEDTVSKNSEAKGIAFSIVDEAIDGLHRSIVAVPVAEWRGHGARDINAELDVRHLARRAGLLEFPGASDEENGDGKKKGGKDAGEVEEEGEKTTPPMRMMVAGERDGVRFFSPLKNQEPDGHEEKQEEIWMGEEHGLFGSVRGEEGIKIGWGDLGIGSVEPGFELEDQRRGFGVFAEVAEGLGGAEIGDLGKAVSPVTDEEAFEPGLLVGAERFAGSLLKKRLETLGERGRRGRGREGGFSLSEGVNNDRKDEDPKNSESPEKSAVSANAREWLRHKLGGSWKSGREFGGDENRKGMGGTPGLGGGFAKVVAEIVSAGIETLDFESVAETILGGFGLECGRRGTVRGRGAGQAPGADPRDIVLR